MLDGRTITTMPTHDENVADPSMVFIELGGKREWVRRAELRGTSVQEREFRPPRGQIVRLEKNPNLLRTFADPEYIEVKGGGPDPSRTPRPPVGACCFRHRSHRPGDEHEECEHLTQSECISRGGTWLGAGVNCWRDSQGFKICPK